MPVRPMRYRMTMLVQSQVLITHTCLYHCPETYGHVHKNISQTTAAEFGDVLWARVRRYHLYHLDTRIVFDSSYGDIGPCTIWMHKLPKKSLLRKLVLLQTVWRLHRQRGAQRAVMAMALHQRLGAESAFGSMGVEVVRCISRFV